MLGRRSLRTAGAAALALLLAAGVLALGAAPASAAACAATDLTPNAGTFEAYDLSNQPISHDGRLIAFSSSEDLTGENDDGSFEVFVHDRDVGPSDTTTQITDSDDDATNARMSGDGSTVTYDLETAGGAQARRYLLGFEIDHSLFPGTDASTNLAVDHVGSTAVALVEDGGVVQLVRISIGVPSVLDTATATDLDAARAEYPDATIGGGVVAAIHSDGAVTPALHTYVYDGDPATDHGVAAATDRVDLSSAPSLFQGTANSIITRTPPDSATSTALVPAPPAGTIIRMLDASADGESVLYLRGSFGGTSVHRHDLPSNRTIRIEANFQSGSTFGPNPDHTALDGDGRTLVTSFGMRIIVMDCGSFTDVPPTHPFFEEIEWAFAEGIAEGFPDGQFGDDAPVSRQAMAAFLHRFSGDPDPTPASPTFTDVSPSHPFYLDIEWGAEREVIAGYGDGTFRPSAPVTRQATAAFIHRLMGNAFPEPSEPTFPDVSVNHPFYEDIEWLAYFEITTGYEDGLFRPANTVTRQAMAAYLFRTNTNVP